MFFMDTTNTVTVSSTLVKLGIIVVLLALIYFFSSQLQMLIARFTSTIGKKIGLYAVDKEYQLQKYVFQHRTSAAAKIYKWVNEQLIVLGLKRAGVTVMGYLLFWFFVSLLVGGIAGFIFKFNLVLTLFLIMVLFVGLLIFTRTIVSGRLEKRENEVMNAIDLIVPELRNGVKAAIVLYQDNFDLSVRSDFKEFISNVQDRNLTFEDSMYILADNLGDIFTDFAQKAIYYEQIGDTNMQEMFTDISETNRLRRQIRDETNREFTALRVNFITTSLMTTGYFIFICLTDEFSRTFFLEHLFGNFLLILCIIIIFGVMAFMSIIKSKAL